MARDQPTVDGNVDTDASDALAELAATAPRYECPYEGDLRERKEQQGKYGILFSGSYNWDNVRCTREAYGDSYKHAGSPMDRSDRRRRSLYFHTTWMDAERALECVAEVPEYNRFHPDHAAAVIRDVDDPTLWVVGRESSVVLYAWTTNAPAVVDRLQSIRERHVADLGDDVEPDIFTPSGPDELGVAEGADTYPGGVGVNVRADDPDALGVNRGDKCLIRVWWD